MKVFFNASIAGKKVHLNAYIRILQAVKELGHEIFSDHVILGEPDTKISKLRKDYRNYSTSIKKLLGDSDVVITEISNPSLAVGYLLHLALQQRKSVLVLYQSNPHALLVGEMNMYLTLKKYSPRQYDKLKEVLKKFFDKSSESFLNIRFNLMIDSALDNALEKRSKKINISKADYIRRLIDDDINGNNK